MSLREIQLGLGITRHFPEGPGSDPCRQLRRAMIGKYVTGWWTYDHLTIGAAHQRFS